MIDDASDEGTFVADPDNTSVAYIYTTNIATLASITFGSTTYVIPSTGLNFALEAHQNFNVTFNATGGFTINPGGQWTSAPTVNIEGI